MDLNRINSIFQKIGNLKIAIVGDFCLDAYWFMDESKSEISLETGLKTEAVRMQKYTLGGAGNVSNNLAALGVGDIRSFGVIGADPFGNQMVGLMKEAGINTDNLLVQPDNWSTHVYAKPYVQDIEQNRMDFGNFNVLSKDTEEDLIFRLEKEIPQMDVILINQQVISGIHTESFKEKLVLCIRNNPEKMFIVDSRNYNDFYKGSYRKMNSHEAAKLCGIIKDPEEMVLLSEIRSAARILFERYKKPLFITRGERGSVVVDENGISEIPGLHILSKIDPVGAGDSYLAGAAVALASGSDMVEAAKLGTYTAGVTVQKLFQTGTATPGEIKEIGKEPDYIYHPELAEDIRQAKYIQDTEIEQISAWPDVLNIKYVIFDHDGTLSTLREGWEKIMAPMMIKAILGSHYSDADEALYHKVHLRVTEYIDKTTGIQTLAQMKGLVEIVREFGCVPEEQIMDEFGYKKIYNEELLRMVRSREKKLKEGELTREDFMIKNAVPLLNKLFNAGIKLFLASGTDEEDVRNEARILGYAHLFKGGIYGAVGDINKEAKKIVLDRILRKIDAFGQEHIATFGDGPVEIRETRKRGGLTIGVASNELKRHSLNESKRTRLVKAGADIIVPDFSQLRQLSELLKIK